MRRLAFGRALLVLLSLGAHIAMPVGVLGHDGGGRLEITPGAVRAGLTVTVRGIALGEAEPVRLELVAADGGLLELGSVESDDDGSFQAVLTIPTDIRTGSYTVQAVLTDGDHVDADIVVEAAIVEGGDLPGAEEPLLQPMPSPAAAVGGPPTSAPDDPVAARSGDPVPTGTPVVPVAIGIGLAALAAIGLRLGRHPRAGG